VPTRQPPPPRRCRPQPRRLAVAAADTANALCTTGFPPRADNAAAAAAGRRIAGTPIRRRLCAHCRRWRQRVAAAADAGPLPDTADAGRRRCRHHAPPPNVRPSRPPQGGGAQARLAAAAARSLTAVSRGPCWHSAATCRRRTAAARRRPPRLSHLLAPARPTSRGGRRNCGRHRRALPPLPLPPRRRRSAANNVPTAASDTAATDRRRQRTPPRPPLRPRLTEAAPTAAPPPPLPPPPSAAAVSFEAMATAIITATAQAATRVGANAQEAGAGIWRRPPGVPFAGSVMPVGVSPAPSRALGAFMEEVATANLSYCWKHTGTRAEKCGHHPFSMKVVSKHLAAGRKHSTSDVEAGRCWPHHSALTAILPECTRGEAPPELVKLHHYSDAQALDLAV